MRQLDWQNEQKPGGIVPFYQTWHITMCDYDLAYTTNKYGIGQKLVE